MTWETVIGLEIHAQLATESKIFSGASVAFGAAPNSQACAIDLGLPGVLPCLNQKAVRYAIMFGLAIDAEINNHSIFARKNYFYPDLPKGYQISQFERPIVGTGHVEIQVNETETKQIGITRAHLEEDAGKSLHEDFHGYSGIDLNRAGTPLLEIVSEPDLRSAEEAVAYLKTIHAIITYLGISDGNMAEGSMRCDINLSIRKQGETAFGTRTEIKNVNSFRFVEKAIQYETARQIDQIESGRTIVQETRLYNSQKNETRSMRSKEEANDYRYFPDPDLLPIEITQQEINKIKARMPEMPIEKRDRFEEEFQLNRYDATLLTNDKNTANYFESVVNILSIEGHAPEKVAKLTCNWVTSELMGNLNKEELSIEQCPISAQALSTLIIRILDHTLSGKLAKVVFSALWNKEGTTDEIIDSRGLKQMTDSTEIEGIIDQVIDKNEQQVAQYRAATDDKRKKLIGFFVGQAMKLSKGKANPQQVNQILSERLNQ